MPREEHFSFLDYLMITILNANLVDWLSYYGGYPSVMTFLKRIVIKKKYNEKLIS